MMMQSSISPLCGAAAPAEDALPEVFSSGEYEYIMLADGTASITGYLGEDEALLLPAELDGRRVTAIGDRAFYWCSSLTSVVIPDGVSAIRRNPFVGCEQLEAVLVSPDHPALETIDGVLFSKADKRLVWYPMTKSASSYAIPGGTAVIGDYAFVPAPA